MSIKNFEKSPRWNSTTKLVVALTIVAITGGFLMRFYMLIGPLLMAFVLSYLLHPVISWLDRVTPLSWRAATSVFFILIVIVLLFLLVLSGVGLVQQVQSMISLLQTGLDALPGLVESMSDRVYQFGPFTLDTGDLDLNTILAEFLAIVQPSLGRMGSLVGTLAGDAAQVLGWTAFILLLSYFVMVESGGLRDRILRINIPRYSQDIERISHELGRIWNAFLRGQFIVFAMAVVVYFLLLSVLGVRYAFGLAFLAGLARFVPYAGPMVTWAVLALVAYFQSFKLFGWEPLTYTLVVLLLALIIDQIFDNFVSPRIMGQALRVHPAGILVAAIVAANLLGLIGIVLAAPILATLKLFVQYIIRKMLDTDPWPEEDEMIAPANAGWIKRWHEKWFSRKKMPVEAETESQE